MLEHENKLYFTVAETAEKLDRTTESIRQSIHHGRFNAVKINKHVYIEAKEVLTFYPDKYDLPVVPEEIDQDFLSVPQFARIIGKSEQTIRKRIACEKIKAFTTLDGVILIPKSQIESKEGIVYDAEELAASL